MSNIDSIVNEPRDEYTNKIIEKIRDHYQDLDDFKTYVKALNVLSDMINIYIHNQNKIYKTFKDEVYCIVGFVNEREYVSRSSNPIFTYKGILPKLLLKTKRDESLEITIEKIPELTGLVSNYINKDISSIFTDYYVDIDFGAIFESYDNIFEDALCESELDDLGNIVDEKSFSRTLQYYINRSLNEQNATLADYYSDSNLKFIFDYLGNTSEASIIKLAEEKNLKNNMFKISYIPFVHTEGLKRSAIEYLQQIEYREQVTNDYLINILMRNIKIHLTFFKLRDFFSYDSPHSDALERLFEEKRKDFEEICDMENFSLPYNAYSFERDRANNLILYSEIFKVLKKDKVINTLSILIFAD